jgi:hypothetical protein
MCTEWALEELEAEDSEAARRKLEHELRERERKAFADKEAKRKREEAQALIDLEIEDDEMLFGDTDAALSPSLGSKWRERPTKDGIMFLQPMGFTEDIVFDPFNPLAAQWHGQGNGTATARSEPLEEDDVPRYMLGTWGSSRHRLCV